MRNENHEVRLLLDDPKPVPNYGESYRSMRLMFRAVTIEDDHVRNISDGWGKTNRSFADFTISTYVHSNNTPGSTFGWHAEYSDIFAMGLEAAEFKVKLLRRVEKGLRRMDEEFGRVNTFGEYVARVAHILSIKTFGWATRRSTGWDHDSNEYAWTNAAGMLVHIDEIIREFQAPNEVIA